MSLGPTMLYWPLSFESLTCLFNVRLLTHVYPTEANKKTMKKMMIVVKNKAREENKDQDDGASLDEERRKRRWFFFFENIKYF